METEISNFDDFARIFKQRVNAVNKSQRRAYFFIEADSRKWDGVYGMSCVSFTHYVRDYQLLIRTGDKNALILEGMVSKMNGVGGGNWVVKKSWTLENGEINLGAIKGGRVDKDIEAILFAAMNIIYWQLSSGKIKWG